MKKQYLPLLILSIFALMFVYLMLKDNGSHAISKTPSIKRFQESTSQEPLRHASDTYEDRRRTLAAACQKLEEDGVAFRQNNGDNMTKVMRLDKQHNVAFCPLFKVLVRQPSRYSATD